MSRGGPPMSAAETNGPRPDGEAAPPAPQPRTVSLGRKLFVILLVILLCIALASMIWAVIL